MKPLPIPDPDTLAPNESADQSAHSAQEELVPKNPKLYYVVHNKPTLLDDARPYLAAYLTTNDIHTAVNVLRRQLKRGNARAARFLLKLAFQKQPKSPY